MSTNSTNRISRWKTPKPASKDEVERLQQGLNMAKDLFAKLMKEGNLEQKTVIIK